MSIGETMNFKSKDTKRDPKETRGWFRRKVLGTISDTSREQKLLNREFFEGVRAGDLEKTKEALEAGADVNAKDIMTYRTALVWAIMTKDRNMVELLLENGADPNTVSVSNNPPLVYAVAADLPEVAEMLLEKGADANAKDSGGVSVLKQAAMNTSVELVKLLKQHGAKE